jgi:hypothetical protein
MQDSEIIDAQALIAALKQQSSLPAELQTEFHDIGRRLSADPNYIDRAIQRCIDLVATHPPLRAAFQNAGNELQFVTNNNRKGIPPKPIDPTLNFSQEIANTVRDVCLAAGQEPPQPVSLWDRLLGKKSKVS